MPDPWRYVSRHPWILGCAFFCALAPGSLSCKRGGRSAGSAAPDAASAAAAPDVKAAGPAAATPTGSGHRFAVSAPLRLIAPQELPTLPMLFEPGGRFIAVRDQKAGCMVWSVTEQTYVGNVPQDRCADWLRARCVRLPESEPGSGQDGKHEDPTSCDYAPVAGRTRRSADGAQTVHWQGGKLWLTRKGGPELPITVGCAKDACPDILAVAFSPDSRQLAAIRKPGDRIHLIDVETGKSEKTLKLAADEAALPELLGWGPHGLAAVIATRSDSAEADSQTPSDKSPATEERSVEAALVLWRSPSAARKAGSWRGSYDEEATQATLVMDPLGRFLFEEKSVRRDGNFLEAIPIGGGTVPALGWHHDEDDHCQESELSDGRWRSGTWPVWETMEARGLDCTPSYSAWQIYTAPGRRSLSQVRLKDKPAEDAVRVVKEDGKTVVTLHGKAARAAEEQEASGDIDPGKRWQGTGKNSLRRLTDQEELIFDDKSCARTATGAFDCKLARFAAKTFLLGDDPLTAPVIHGVQVAHLFHHPNLVEDFFAGNKVTIDPAVQGPVGLPPRLDKTAVRYLDGQAPNLEVTLLAHDGGDGVAAVRVWVDGVPLPLAKPVSLVAEQPTAVALDIPPATCAHVSVQVCNTPGRVCSMPVDVPFCSKKKHRIK